MSLRLEEDLVTRRVRKLHDLVFDGRAVSRPARAYGPTVHRRFCQVLLDDGFCCVTRVRDPAGQLRRMTRLSRHAATRLGPEMRPGIIELLDFAFLTLERRVVHRPAIDPGWRPSLEARNRKPHSIELLREMR